MVQSKWNSVEEALETSEMCEKEGTHTHTMLDESDDHGLAIFGHRIRKPIFLDDDDE